MHSLTKNIFLAMAFNALSCAGSNAADLSVEEQAMIDWIDDHAEDSIELLGELVNIGSGQSVQFSQR